MDRSVDAHQSRSAAGCFGVEVAVDGDDRRRRWTGFARRGHP
ncbi:hypothetical protein HMPREF0776_1223, partial [Staphylococcus aureus subsp. aureus USA300_TCH959]